MDEVTGPELLTEGSPFFFNVKADNEGLAVCSFKKDSIMIHTTLMALLHVVNESFTTPFPNVGDFCRHLGSVFDGYDRMIYEREQQATIDGERAAAPLCGEEEGIGLRGLDSALCTERDQGPVPPSGS